MKFLLALLALLIASPAFSTNNWTMCGGGPSTNSRVTEGECKEYEFNDSQTGEVSVRVQATTALVSFDPDNLSTGVPGAGPPAELMIQLCVAGKSVGVNTCEDILSANLTGLGGAAATQLRAERVGSGLFRLVISVAAPVGDVAVIQVQGE